MQHVEDFMADIEELKNKHVYCTNCKHFEIVDKYQKDDEGMAYCKHGEIGLCDFWDPEDSKPLMDRPFYQEMIQDKIICLVGPSGIGKTSIVYVLKEKYGYNVIESYTTRPPRHKGEKGHTFVDKFNYLFDGKVLPDNVIAFNKYNGYEYWATREQYQDEGVSIYVVDIPGVKMLRETVRDAEIIVITLWADADTRWDRLYGRGDNQANIIERIAYDNKAFAIIPCDYSVDANTDLDTVVERVNSIIETVAKQQYP